MESAIQLRGVTKTFGATRAVDNLDLEIPAGRLYGLIGPNGAGKTTTIRMVMSILQPDSGTIAVLGCPSALEPKDRVGYLPEERGIYRKMRAVGFLEYIAHLKGVDGPVAAERARQRLDSLGLGECADKRCESLSKGTQQKIQFLAAMIHNPDLIILDEPFSGLDPVSTLELRKIILAEHRRGATIVFSTHVMAHAEEICDHIVMIHRGRKVLDDPITAILRRFDPRAIRLQPLHQHAEISCLQSLPEVERASRANGELRVELVRGTDPGAAIARLAHTIPCSRIELARPTLEEIFIGIVARDGLAPQPAPSELELRSTTA
jgi:ABC-2 type transport system ATP-binding protein